MSESIIVLIFTVCYIVLTYAVVAVSKVIQNRKTGHDTSRQQFVSAAGTLGFVATIGLVIGNIVTSDYTVGFLQSVYTSGASAIIMFICWQITNVLFGIFCVPLYRSMLYKYNATTLTDAMNHIFQNSWISKLVAIVTAIAFVATFSAGALAVTALVAPMTGLPYNLVYWASVIIFIALAMMGGLKGIANANILHALVMFIAIIILFVFCMRSVDFSAVMTTLPPETKNVFHIAPSELIGIFITQSSCGFCSALLGSAALGSRNTKTARNANIILACYIIFYIIIALLIAFISIYFYPDIDSSSAFYAICHRFGPIVTALGGVATFAAVFSSAPTLLLVGCNGLVDEVYFKTKRGKNVSDKKALLITKIVIVIVGLAMPAITKGVPTILTLTSNAWTIMGVLGAVFIISYIWKRPNAKSTFWGMLVGSVLCIIWVFAYFITGVYPLGISAAYAGIFPGLGTMIIMTLITCKDRISPEWANVKVCMKEMKDAIKKGTFH